MPFIQDKGTIMKTLHTIFTSLLIAIAVLVVPAVVRADDSGTNMNPSLTATPSATPTSTATPTKTPTITPTPTGTITVTPSVAPTVTKKIVDAAKGEVEYVEVTEKRMECTTSSYGQETCKEVIVTKLVPKHKQVDAGLTENVMMAVLGLFAVSTMGYVYLQK